MNNSQKDFAGITEAKLVEYICDNINISTPGTRDLYTLWSRDGEILKTRDSHEFRDNNIEKIVSIEFFNEYAPYSPIDVANMLKYELEQQRDDEQ